MNSTIFTGKIKFYVRGFGFIIDSVTGNEIYYHITSCVSKNIKKDDVVTYEVVKTERGLQAMNVKIIGYGTGNK